MISLRPTGQHGPVRRAAARHGGAVVALSPWSVQPRDSRAARESLQAALAAPFVVFTSPAAAGMAGALQALHRQPGQQWFAVGAGTAAALRRAGVDTVDSPARMDSEGLLALPGLQRLAGRRLGLVTAPGGRGTLVPAFEARGALVLRADVYERVPHPLPPRQLARLHTLDAPAVLAVSSGEALQRVVEAAGAAALDRLRALPVIAASDRLATLAADLGFADRHRAASARPADMVAAAAVLAASPAFARVRGRLARSPAPGPEETPR
ncbi:uroporphyrinogen-III synthase [Lysobacter sp. GX 14042]|uniref:uroporphyrinogen-III synthase n=1 Tax=Lysobacter sp. GX 14042 TaxID=2907155 RepID=UPI001F15F62C|nr:uroporphyrinogen-III synthase [Lysobacter sp. GX 14042]